VKNYYIEIDGQSFICPKGKTLLIAMKKMGVNYLPLGCCAGGCGVCKVRVLEGDYETKVMSRAKVSIEDEARGFALACRILPKSDLKIERVKD
jgi:ferredoxin